MSISSADVSASGNVDLVINNQPSTEESSLLQRLQMTRQHSVDLCKPLATEDYGIQPMADASPPKWHLAHTSWFFETFLLQEYLSGYQPFAAGFDYLFNSYYNGVGAQFPRERRGSLSRPTVAEVFAYRQHVDAAMDQLLQMSGRDVEQIHQRCELGIQHEQQHQELLLTDLKYNFGFNPLYPVYVPNNMPNNVSASTASATVTAGFHQYAGGRVAIGVNGGSQSFCFDNETPQHDVLLRPYELATQLVTNAEYLAFVEAGGYQRSELWLANGWTKIQQQQWQAPLYWQAQAGQWWEYHLTGLAPLTMDAPVCHLSYYEADAYARFVGARLPTEFEWENAAHQQALEGHFVDAGVYRPLPAQATAGPLQQLYGDVWEWTCSSYGAYPGYQPLPGTLGEYNGKFMSEQLVLRGGSCFSSTAHLRSSYRNFFYPPDRWQMSGLRLARDC